ncbi:MAG TPA: condensation domain-containing protein, partial [Candidatus Deferrimicrobium sp.]|nr:condensation domain-containing protein [Candidatus Deferrimicrobium sp.]
TNIGHLDAAAGIAGFIKTVLSLHYRLIPPSLNFKAPNPQIDFENSPFYVNTQLKTWESNEYPLRAGVSSFGLGGTNVHVILEEYAKQQPEMVLSEKENGTFDKLVLLSAKTPAALDRMSKNLECHFVRNPGINLADTAYTLQVGRGSFVYRKMLVCSDTNEAIRKLQADDAETAAAKEGKHTVIFMFSGQGSQYVNMGLDLYQNEPLFRGQVDECFHLLENITGMDMKTVLYPGEGKITFEEAEEKIFQFKYTTPIKFIFEYSLAKMLMKWGIRPDAMIGHSFGEYVAACLAGVFSLEDGLYLAALRGELMHGLPDGAMLGVPFSEKELERRLTGEDELCIAAINGKSLCVVSGPVEAVNRFEEQSNREGHDCLRFQVPKAGHSRMVEPILAEFKQKIGKVKFVKPRIPFISCVSGTWITAEEAVDPGYWTRHLREPVRFADGLTTLFKEPNPVFLQTSPGKGLILFINQHPDNKEDTPALSMVRHRKEPVSDVYHTMIQIGRLWLNGIENHIDWPVFYGEEGEKKRRIPLPSYPFEGIHYPVNRNLFKPGAPVMPFSKESGPHESRKKTDMLNRAAGPREEKPVSILRGRRPHLATLYIPPRSPREKEVAGIWEKLLGYDQIGIRDNFFELNGDSLKAVIAISKIHKQTGVKVPLKDFFTIPTVEGIVQYIDEAKDIIYNAIEPVEKKEYYPLSPAQEGMFILNLYEEGRGGMAYNNLMLMELEGEFNSEKFQVVILELIRRHESLRTSFLMINDEPVQIIKEKVEFEIDKSFTDLFQIKKFVRPFDLSCAPLLRVGLLKIEEKRHILMLDMHHIITDGTSFNVFAKEFMTLYSGMKLPPLNIQYKDFVLWQNSFEETGKMAKQEIYWLGQFAGEMPILNIMTDFPRPAVQSFAGSTLKFEVGQVDTAALRTLALKEGITLYMLFLAVFNILLSKLGGQEDIIVGMPTAGRRHADLQQIIGMFVNTLALRNFPVANKTFREFLKEVKQKTLAAFENQEYPFENLVEKVVVNRDTGRNPLFDVIFVLQNIENVEIA